MQEQEFRQIFDHTVGILFLGSLHNEDHSAFEELALRCAAIEFRTTAKKVSVIEALRESGDWDSVKEVMCNFRELTLGISVRSFCETRKTVYQSGRWGAAKSSCVRRALLAPILIISI